MSIATVLSYEWGEFVFLGWKGEVIARQTKSGLCDGDNLEVRRLRQYLSIGDMEEVL